MATRLRADHQEEARKKIQTSQLINRLQNHVLNGDDIKKTQVTAAIALLKKVLPDLQSIEGAFDMSIRKHEDMIDELDSEKTIPESEADAGGETGEGGIGFS